jgi:hypothetical protein
MARSLNDLRTRRAAAKFSGTFRGRLVNVGGQLFALYCLFRFITVIILFPSSSSPSSPWDCNLHAESKPQCFVNVFFPVEPSSSSTSYPDIATEVVAKLLSKVSPEIQFDDVARAMRHVSLVLVGVIVLSSIRLVLRGVTRVSLYFGMSTSSN